MQRLGGKVMPNAILGKGRSRVPDLVSPLTTFAGLRLLRLDQKGPQLAIRHV